MSSYTRHPRRVQVEKIERHSISSLGNPTYRVTFSDGTVALTSSNSSVAYDAENVLRSRAYVVPSFTKAGRIATWEKATEPTLAERMDELTAPDSAAILGREVQLTQLSANFSRVYLGGGGTVWFSYRTPVAAAMPGYGTARTAQKFSSTTSKHLGSQDELRAAQVLTAEQFAAFLGSVVR